MARDDGQQSFVAFIDTIATLVADRVANAILDRVARGVAPSSPWMRTEEAWRYSGLRRGTFKQIAAGGALRRHRWRRGSRPCGPVSALWSPRCRLGPRRDNGSQTRKRRSRAL